MHLHAMSIVRWTSPVSVSTILQPKVRIPTESNIYALLFSVFIPSLMLYLTVKCEKNKTQQTMFANI